MTTKESVPLLDREDLPQLKRHVADWIQWMEGLRVFINSRERIKRPEGVDLHEEEIEAMRAVLSIVADSIEHGPATERVDVEQVRAVIAGLTFAMTRTTNPVSRTHMGIARDELAAAIGDKK